MRLNNVLKVGDNVIWRGRFGLDEPQKAKITGIQVNIENGSKEGISVNKISWSSVKERKQILDLDNNHWCWSYQVAPDMEVSSE